MVGWANVGDWLVGPTVSNSVGPTLGNGWLGNRKKECQSVPLANRGWQRWANCMPTTCATRVAASSSRGDFKVCVNLLQACFTLAFLSCQPCCKLADLQCKFDAN
ncbi:hypothetical protein AVEN_164279-1 [Araneus ventricosus]|uniref:Uncharacterized protein n=1 Tax=Araneus ventricosus TaxID=182803 RepID=A0A4Y2GWD4_ARAVE|nr:hypothetical protein AVEN_164279-1 [Araneus ventricosus]